MGLLGVLDAKLFILEKTELKSMKKYPALQRLAFLVCLANSLIFKVEATVNLTPDEARSFAIDAYIYGYPLVTMEMTEKVMTNVASAGNQKAPVGQFANSRNYPNASFREVTAPNADTLYSTAWLDLTQEPYILHLPNMNGRYFLMPLLSAWTTVFAAPGSRTIENKEQNIAITGPNWQGNLPSEITKEYKSPTNTVWILGRTYCSGTPKDFSIVHSLQDQYKLMPLSAFGKAYLPPQGQVDPAINMNRAVKDQVNGLDAKAFFTRLANQMKNNPPPKEDALMVKKLEALGIIPGKAFDMTQLLPDVAQAIQGSVKLAQEKIRAHESQAGITRNGWTFPSKAGDYGTDYLQRAYIAAFGLGANKAEDAIYPFTKVDSQGKKLSGQNRYVIHFENGQIPTVKGFWSLTMYNNHFFFIQNPLNRYSLGSKDNLKKNADGSMDLYLQHDSPGKDKESNWLPAPEGEFNLILRLYWPTEAILKSKWDPPPVTLVN